MLDVGCSVFPRVHGEIRGGFVVPMRGQKTVEALANHFAKIGNFALTPRGGPANDIAKSRDEVVTSVWSGCRPATGWAGCHGSCRAGTVVRGRKKALGLSADHAPGGAKGAGNETRAVADRCFSARETGGKESHLRAARRQTESVAPGLLRSRRAAADIRRSSRFRARRPGESVRAGGGSVAGFAALRRALGTTLARRGALRGHEGPGARVREGRAAAVCLHLSRLRHTRVQ